MSDYDLKAHSFPPALIVKSVFSGQQLTMDTCATETESRSSLTNSLQEQSTKKPSLLQVGGKHYKGMRIQPVQYNHANSIPFIEGSVIKYISRWREKNGLQDLLKAKHFIDLLIELEENK